MTELSRRSVLITPRELRGLGDGAAVLDVRWALGDPYGRQHYLAAHIPGAVHVDLDTELAGAPSFDGGRAALPDIATVRAVARRCGVRADRPVVVYDDDGGTAAARVWWLLRWAGLRDVRILDGAFRGWIAAGYPPSTTDESPEASDVELSPGHLPVLTADEAAVLADRALLLDTRSPTTACGESGSVDRRAGHIPGALSFPTGQNLTVDGRFRPTTELWLRFSSVSGGRENEIGVYGGAGATAAHTVAVLAVLGVTAALYPGSGLHRPARYGLR